MTEFNLITDPWVAVTRRDGTVDELSLRDVFEHAGDIKSIAGEIPTQDAAVLRLLEAILMRATARRRSEDDCLRQWGQWWNASTLPIDDIDSYLARHRNRFNLLGAESPFMQVADLHTEKGGTSGLVKIIAEVPAGSRFFTTRDGEGVESLSFGEAARWLIHCHAFDISGIKSGAVGDDRVKGGRGYPIGTGITGNMGLVIAEGSSLRHTLLLNLVLRTDPRNDVPIWEREPQGAGEDWDHPVPNGPADLFTWQSRRIRLLEHAGRIDDVLLCNGDKVEWGSLLGNDPMTGWRFSKPQSKKAGHDVYMPRAHETGRAIWRGLEPHLTRSHDKDWIRPEVIDWLASARQAGFLAADQMIVLRTIGMQYGPQNSVVTSVVDDSLPTSIAVLGEDALAALAVTAAQTAQDVAICLANLASDLARAAGTDSDADRSHAWETAFATIDPVYRSWFAHLTSTTDPDSATRAWQHSLREVIDREGFQLCLDAGDVARTGRMVAVPNTDREDLIDTAEAWRKFTWRVSRATPALTDETTARNATGTPGDVPSTDGKENS
ncbi:MAG: type I-E CRISPR-associated protein Cse1/CasA [Acidipropionibacterium jensenii]|nr:type I-E CRISPR-associated protein Cse1/CasA [Acidipropionibacterium jensenii]